MSSVSFNAAMVVTLKKTVPMSWTKVTHQSRRRGSAIMRRASGRVAGAPGATARAARSVCRCCSAAAEVKNAAPITNVTPTARGSSREATAGSEASAKHAEPITKSRPIHHPIRRIAPAVSDGTASAAGTASESGRNPSPIRWRRDVHSRRPRAPPSYTARETNGPPRRSRRSASPPDV
ncbi:hypothetical protein [Miltoncostaea oceani]|uniref:hypothetical protein n=1 Tax=Miltoncostaea oceani TaxID=2843216 RepID=UPI001C3D6D05|nr:hypothetical protein [Miltoncostaea oceani]